MGIQKPRRSLTDIFKVATVAIASVGFAALAPKEIQANTNGITGGFDEVTGEWLQEIPNDYVVPSATRPLANPLPVVPSIPAPPSQSANSVTNTTTTGGSSASTLSIFDAGRDTGNFLASAGVKDIVRYVKDEHGKIMAIMPTEKGPVLLDSTALTDGLTALTNRGDRSSDYFANALKGMENLSRQQKEDLPHIDSTDGPYNKARDALFIAAGESNRAVSQALKPAPALGVGIAP